MPVCHMYSYCLPLLLGSILMVSVLVFGSENVYLGFIKMLFKVATTWAILILPGFYLSRLLTRRTMRVEKVLRIVA
jgi:hypothetical protein